ncbi:MAG: hypothetical protein LBB85_09190 [Dysgonamonadaceae bacterium]|jgi:hypothetical protein|nr:hypothetical protein [Dysgonamonadaceae bacterium]
MAIKLDIQDDGNLEISICDWDELEYILSREYNDERAYLCDLMESARYTGNDWHCPLDIGLTEAPAIAQGAIYPEDENENDGFPADYENLWYFSDYMMLSYLEILKEEGRVIFTGHPDNSCKRKIEEQLKLNQ